MGIVECLGAFLDVVPLVRGLWRRLWERRLDIEFHSPISHLPGFRPDVEGARPIRTVNVRPANPYIYAWLNLTVVNNRTDRPERIQGIELHLKKRRLWFWRETIAQAVASEHTHTPSGFPQDIPFTDWLIEPMSARTTRSIWAEGPMPHPHSLPRYVELVLHFKMVGPMRHMTRTLKAYKHDPKAGPRY